MTEKVKKGDFVELEYTGRFKEDNFVFDTTNEEIAKNNNIHSPGMIYGPVKICIGHRHVIKGLDESLDNSEVGKEIELDIPTEKAFGKKDAKLLKLMPMSAFKGQQINPVPGMQLNIDGVMTTVRSVSGGRVVIDFNHPFAGKDVIYKYQINRHITDPAEKIRGCLSLLLTTNESKIKVSVEADKANVEIDEKIPIEYLNAQKPKLIEMVPEIKTMEFKVKT